jgi:hypothetical protein
MYNRKFDIRRDFSKLNEFENTIMPIVRKVQNEEEREVLTVYLRKIFNNQFKTV